jgi:phosphatidylglycerol---prolipoprotein diacylglyceryl transferase
MATIPIIGEIRSVLSANEQSNCHPHSRPVMNENMFGLMLAGSVCWPLVSIDPVLLRMGSFEIRWYGLMYVFAAIAGALVGRSELRRKGGPVPEQMLAEMLFYALVGMIIGGRVGYVLIYHLGYYLEDPIRVFATWKGGMSFHGGLLGVVVAGLLLARKRGVPFMELADIAVVAGPIGIMLVKIGNFMNGELYGLETTLPWGIVFPLGGDTPRHPSQLYEAFLEGPVLFAILWHFRLRANQPGELFALFLLAYGSLRFIVEFFRQPDVQIGFVLGCLTMGQMLCLCMIGVGAALLAFVKNPRRNARSDSEARPFAFDQVQRLDDK